MTSPTPTATPTQGTLSVGPAKNAVVLNDTFHPILGAAVTGGPAVDDYYAHMGDAAQSLNALYEWLSKNEMLDEVEGDGTPVKSAQAGNAAVRVRVDPLTHDVLPAGVKATSTGTVNFLAGTDHHSTITTAIDITAAAAGLTAAVAQYLGLTSVAAIVRACANAGQALIEGGQAVGEAGIEMAVQQGAAEAAGGEVAAVGADGAVVAVEAVAGATAEIPGVNVVVGALALTAVIVADLVEKEQMHWLDVYNLTGVALTLTQPWEDGASFSTAPTPPKIPAATLGVADAASSVSYTSYTAQNSDGVRGLAYMVAITGAGGESAAKEVVATVHVTYGGNNSMLVQEVAQGGDYGDLWGSQTRQENTQVTTTLANGYQAVLTMNSLSGADEHKYKSVLYIIDPAMFPSFDPSAK